MKVSFQLISHSQSLTFSSKSAQLSSILPSVSSAGLILHCYLLNRGQHMPSVCAWLTKGSEVNSSYTLSPGAKYLVLVRFSIYFLILCFLFTMWVQWLIWWSPIFIGFRYIQFQQHCFGSSTHLLWYVSNLSDRLISIVLLQRQCLSTLIVYHWLNIIFRR